MGTDSGSLLALDHGFLDPRLPRLDPNKMTKIEYDARRKELAKKGINVGVEVISDRMAQNLSHRHQVVGMRGVASAPTLLESTSAVFAWGTDLFYTRTFPSRQFDGLSDDFAYLGVGLRWVAATRGARVCRKSSPAAFTTGFPRPSQLGCHGHRAGVDEELGTPEPDQAEVGMTCAREAYTCDLFTT